MTAKYADLAVDVASSEAVDILDRMDAAPSDPEYVSMRQRIDARRDAEVAELNQIFQSNGGP